MEERIIKDINNLLTQLFQKMKEAGYEWDADKKELRKIEQNHAWSEDNIKEFKAELQSLMFEWSNKKDNMGVCIDRHIDKLLSILWNHTQNTWKPSDEQIKVCKEVYADILSAKGFDLGTVNGELNRLEAELKKLKDEK